MPLKLYRNRVKAPRKDLTTAPSTRRGGAFSSSGFATKSGAAQSSKSYNAPDFDFEHAKDAPDSLRASSSSRSNDGWIDAVSTADLTRKSRISHPQPRVSSILSVPRAGDDQRAIRKRILQQSDLIGLERSSAHSYKQLRIEESVLDPLLADETHEGSTHSFSRSEFDDDFQGLDQHGKLQNGAYLERLRDSVLYERYRPYHSLFEEPVAPPSAHTPVREAPRRVQRDAYELLVSPSIAEEEMEMEGFGYIGQPSSSPTRNAGGTVLSSLWDNDASTHPLEEDSVIEEAKSTSYDAERLTRILLDSWPTIEPWSSRSPRKMRLTGDRSGIGAPLTRFVGDETSWSDLQAPSSLHRNDSGSDPSNGHSKGHSHPSKLQDDPRPLRPFPKPLMYSDIPMEADDNINEEMTLFGAFDVLDAPQLPIVSKKWPSPPTQLPLSGQAGCEGSKVQRREEKRHLCEDISMLPLTGEEEVMHLEPCLF